MMYVTWFYRLILWLGAVLFGPIGYFIARYTGVLESIYGNNIDGWGGDKSYRDNEAKKWFRKYWPDFWWSVVRNPANNLARHFTVFGVVRNIIHGTYFHTAIIGDQRVWFFYTPYWPVMFKLGYKLWPSVVNGNRLSAKLAFSLQRGHK